MAFRCKLHKLCCDFIKDKEGLIFLVGVKSFELTKESFMQKTLKPTAAERELLFRSMGIPIPKVPCAQCTDEYLPTQIEKNILSIQ